MDNGELLKRLEALEKKMNDTFESAEKTRKYVLVITIVTVAAVVLPLIGLVFAVPAFIATYSQLGAF